MREKFNPQNLEGEIDTKEDREDSQREQLERMRESKIVLHFMRHGKPESLQDSGTDEERHLSDEGMKQARSKANKQQNLRQSIAYGSPRLRSQETAGYVMAGDSLGEDIEPKDIKYILNEDINVGSKIGTKEELNFNVGSPDFAKEADKSYGEGRYLEFIINESDALAVQLRDKEATTLSVQAGNIAEIVMKYVEASSRWNQLVNDPEKKYDENLDRFLGSHQGVIESFLCKAVSDNKLKADLIASSLSLKGGFDFVEGITIDIVQKDSSDEPEIILEFSKKTEDGLNFDLKEKISMEKIKKIINEKNNHFEKIAIEKEKDSKKEKLENDVTELVNLCGRISERFDAINKSNLNNWDEYLRKNRKVSMFLRKVFSEKKDVDPYDIRIISGQLFSNLNHHLAKQAKKGLEEFEKFKSTDQYVNPELSKDEYLKLKDEITNIRLNKGMIKYETFDKLKQRMGTSESNIERLFSTELRSRIEPFKQTGSIFAKEGKIEFDQDIQNITETIKELSA